MNDNRKTKAQLIHELEGLRRRIAELEKSETERKRAEDALIQSEERYRTILDNTQEGYYEVDLAGNFTFVNDAECKDLGYTREELIGMNYKQYTTETTAKKEYELFNRVYRTGEQIKGFEGEFIKKNGAKGFNGVSVSVIRNKEGKSVGFRGLSRDITDRKRTEEALKQSEEKYRNILESIEDGYYEVDLAGNYTFFNPSFCTIYGYPREEVLGMNYRQYTSKDNAQKLYQACNQVYRTGEPAKGIDWEVIKKDGTKLYVESSVSLMKNDSGQPIGFRGVVRDISERKRTEEVLESERNLLRNLIDNVPDRIYAKDTESRFIICNEAMARRMGVTSPNELVGKSDFDLLPRELAQRFYDDEQAIIQSGTAMINREEPLMSEGGKVTRWNLATKVPLLDKQGNRIGLVGVGREITDRKQAEEAVRISEEKYRNIFENSVEGIFQSTPEGQYISVNPAMAFMHGYDSPEEMIKSITNIGEQIYVNPEDRKRYLRLLSEQGIVKNFEAQYYRKDGTKTWNSLNTRTVKDSTGNVLYYEGTKEDITQRKQAEEALRESEQRLNNILHGSPIPAFVITKDHKVMYWNKALEEMTGIKTVEVIGTNQHWKAFYNEKRPCMADLLVDGEIDVIPQWYEGKYTKSELIEEAYEATDFLPELGEGGRWLRFTAAIIRNSRGDLIGVLETLEDITERKQTEEALKQSEKKYRNIFENSVEGIFQSTPEGQFISVNPAMALMHGYTSQEEMIKSITNIGEQLYVNSEDRARFLRILSEQGIVNNFEAQFYRKDGTKTWNSLNCRAVKDSTGKVLYHEGTKEDITQRRQAEEALRESEQRLNNILQGSPTPAFVITKDHKVMYWNKALEEMTGIKTEEIIGTNQHWKAFYGGKRPCMADLLVDGELDVIPQWYEGKYTKSELIEGAYEATDFFPALGEGGRWLRFTAVNIRSSKGDLIGALETLEDITERKRADEALKQSEEKYRNILESIQDGYCEVDLAGHYTFFNPAYCTIKGYTREELLGRSFRQNIGKENAQKLYQASKQAYKTGEPTKGIDWEIVKKDETRLYVESSVSLMKNDSGQPVGFRGLIRDITERKRAEEALKQSEEKYRTILENIEDGYYEVDLAGNLTFFNDAMCRLLAYSRDELMGINNLMYTDTENSEKLFQSFNKVYRIGEPIKDFNLEVTRKDGTKRFGEISISLIKDPEGKPIGFRGIARDVTERKEIELELKKHREHLEEMVGVRTIELARTTNFLENILNSSLDGIITTDAGGNILYASSTIKNIIGYEKNEVTGKNVNRFFARGIEESKKIITEVMEKGEIRGYELRFTKKSGESIVLNLSISLLRDEKGEVTGTTTVYRDVTEEKKMAKAIEQEKLRAEAATKAKSQFLANMSHEIRTPLNGIMGMSELCLETELDKEQTQIVGTINKEANSLLEIVNKILDFSKIEAGKLEIERVPFDLKNLLEDVIEGFSYQTIQKGLELISFISPDISTRIVGDPGRLRQVLRNLIGNAIKFTHEGKVVVKVELEQELADKIKLRFLVKDTGIGIPKEKQVIIFESFTQADGSTTRKYGGTGLGITISKQLAELMGGEIGVDSAEGKGSTFWFTSVFSKQSETDSPRRKEVPLSNVRVLVVDDNKTNRQTLIENLKSWSAVPVEAESAKKALSILKGSMAKRKQVNLILIDLNIPDMNGFDLARKIRSVKSFSLIPIIILTSVGNPGDGKTCRNIGIEGYLKRPVRERDLRRAIETVLGPSNGGESGRKIDLVTQHSIAEGDRKEIRILLAEDYPTNQQVAKRHLDHAGYQVDLAEDGEQALEAFKRKHYDLILMDLQMPHMDGYQATKAIRALESALAAMENKNAHKTMPRVPIIAMTAHAMKEYKELCLEAGMDDFLSKPLTKKELLSMVAKWLNSRSRPSNLSGSAPNPPPKTGQDISPIEIQPGNPIDWERAMKEFEGDKEFLSEVIEGFTKKVSEQIGTIRKALSCGDAETVRKEAHSIKGGAANLTAVDLSRVAFELESKGKSKELNGAGEIVDGLEREFETLRRYVQENLEKAL